MKHRLTVDWESETEIDKLDNKEYGWKVRLTIQKVIKDLIDFRVGRLDSVVVLREVKEKKEANTRLKQQGEGKGK